MTTKVRFFLFYNDDHEGSFKEIYYDDREGSFYTHPENVYPLCMTLPKKNEKKIKLCSNTYRLVQSNDDYVPQDGLS